MTEKRFELTMSGNEVAQYEIIDHSQKVLTVYNDLGNVYFSSAMKICELLNSLADENEQLKKENERLCNFNLHMLLDEKNKEIEQLNDENEQLKKENHGIQDKVIRLLNYVEVKQCVTRTEIKKWWNGDVE